MLLDRWLRPGPAKAAGQRLYAATVAAARAPELYQSLGAPDTPDGRFELYTLHVPGRATAQALFDAYLSGLDNGLRELAVGDLSVAKTMRKLGEAFYGRGRALDAALAELPDRGPLQALIHRTVLGGAAQLDPGPLADYVLAARQGLAAAPDARVAVGDTGWPQPALVRP